MDTIIWDDILSTIKIVGELNYDNCREVESQIGQLVAASEGPISLRLDSLDFIDSSGMLALASVARAARGNGKTIRIASLNMHVAHVLHLSGIWDLFDIAADVVIHPSERMKACSTGLINMTIHAARIECRAARNGVAHFADEMGFVDEDVDDIRLAVGEALSNAVRHGAVESETIIVRSVANEDRMQIVIRYPSDIFDPDRIPIPDLNAPCENGRGIYFMKLVMDSVRYRFDSGHALITLTKKRKCAQADS